MTNSPFDTANSIGIYISTRTISITTTTTSTAGTTTALILRFLDTLVINLVVIIVATVTPIISLLINCLITILHLKNSQRQFSAVKTASFSKIRIYFILHSFL